MDESYHIQITTRALQALFASHALQAVIAANLKQDSLRFQIGHPEIHFDDNLLKQGYAYIQDQRDQILEALSQRQVLPAWQAFGRLTHGVQDFYAHSNYIQLWLETRPGATPEQVEPLVENCLESPRLITGKLYYPLEVLAFIPGLEPLVKPYLPRDSHTWMNLDSPRRGPLFAYAFSAAIKRTHAEYERINGIIHSNLGAEATQVFRGLFPNPIRPIV